MRGHPSCEKGVASQEWFHCTDIVDFCCTFLVLNSLCALMTKTDFAGLDYIKNLELYCQCSIDVEIPNMIVLFL